MWKCLGFKKCLCMYPPFSSLPFVRPKASAFAFAFPFHHPAFDGIVRPKAEPKEGVQGYCQALFALGMDLFHLCVYIVHQHIYILGKTLIHPGALMTKPCNMQGGGAGPMSSAAMSRVARVLERMANQNTFADVSMDFRVSCDHRGLKGSSSRFSSTSLLAVVPIS